MLFCVPGHAQGREGHQHKGGDGWLDSADGLPRGHHQQEREPGECCHHQPGTLPLQHGCQDPPPSAF